MTPTPHRRGILLDIEGTTTPISFVHEVLFPYARTHVRNYLANFLDLPETRDKLTLLEQEHGLDVERDLHPPPLVNHSRHAEIDSMVSYVEWLIDRDRKSSGLKALQGRIWEQGYADGTLRAPLFPDVLPALQQWHQTGLRIAIFSSGSVLAQKLLFAHTEAGDVTKLLDFYFDTTTGPKMAAESYRVIAARLELTTNELLFISDVAAELEAASNAGCQTRLCIRPGNPPQPDQSHQLIFSFAELLRG